jgi:hypothetical protein
MEPFWKDKPGTTNSNWFKDHPKATLCLLCGVVVLLVVVTL